MTVDQALGVAVADAARGRVTFAQDFQGFPGTVHGGAVAALFHRLALPRPAARLSLTLQRGVPTETALGLTAGSAGVEARLSLDHEGRRLAEAALTRDVEGADDVEVARRAWRDRGEAEAEVPVTRTCLACGTANPLGLALRFRYNARRVWQEYTPGEAYRGRAGSTHPALAGIALDELGWWLGALAHGECGVTTEVEVTWLADLPAGPVVILGDREAVAPDADPRGRYSRVAGWLLSPEGEVLARARVRFAASRAYTRRLLGPFLETTARSALAAVFPGAEPGA